MPQISPQLLDTEYETYLGFKYFLKNKQNSFGEDMNSKYTWQDDALLKLDDKDAYDHILKTYVIENPEDYK